MKVIDRYILRELMMPIVVCSLSLISLILVADIFDNLAEFLHNDTSFKIIASYYANLIPYAFVQTVAWAAWLGTLYLLVNFGFHNELLAMKVAGITIASIIRPVLFFGFLLGIFVFIVSDRVVPPSYRKATELSDIYIHKRTEANDLKVLRNITFRSAENHLYYFRSLTLKNPEAANVIVLWLDNRNEKARQKISARTARWKNGVWEFNEVTEHQIDSRGRLLGEPHSYVKKIYPELTASPEDLSNASRDSVFLSYRDMKKAMMNLKSTGVDISSEMVDIHQRLATPWQGLIMMLIVVPLLAPTRSRKGIALFVLICVGLIFTYHVTSAVGLALGKSGKLLPFLSAWLGNIIFSVGALIALDKANF